MKTDYRKLMDEITRRDKRIKYLEEENKLIKEQSRQFDYKNLVSETRIEALLYALNLMHQHNRQLQSSKHVNRKEIEATSGKFEEEVNLAI